MRSLRSRLLASLALLLAVATTLQVLVSFRAATTEADALFDYQMRQMAFSLREGSYQGVAGALDATERADFVIQIWSREGVRMYLSRPYAVLPDQARLGYSTVELPDGDWRVYALQGVDRTIQIAQPFSVRRAMAFGLAARATWPIVPFALAALAAIGWVVTRALAPVRRASDELRLRGADALAPLAGGGVPTEVRPLIDEINALMVRMREAIDAQRRFVADAAHELRSPLTAVKLQLQLLERARDDTQRDTAQTRLRQAIERANRLVEQLLALARQEAAITARVPTAAVDLRECAAQAIAEMLPLADSRGVDVALDAEAPGGSQVVIGDEDALRVLLRNLVDNAIRHARSGGRVDVRLSRPAGTVGGGGTDRAPGGTPDRVGDAVELRIEDDGPGIPPEDRARVLDRFHRRPGEPADGSGLGLAIVDAVARQHGATVELGRSDRLGGLAVIVRFGS